MNIGTTQIGVRLHEMKDDWSDLIDGAYFKLPNGDWAIRPPGWHYGTISPKVHTIEEHADGTMTVSPSIIFRTAWNGEPQWHGYLKKGIWSRVP